MAPAAERKNPNDREGLCGRKCEKTRTNDLTNKSIEEKSAMVIDVSKANIPD
jgi:hypothetical protein